MKLKNTCVLVTGANRGLGLALATALRERGARRVYAGVRNPDAFALPGMIPVRLDVTRPEDVTYAAEQCADVNLVINNAGIASPGAFLDADSEAETERHLATNFYGMLRVCRAFAPVLAANGGGAILNVLSVGSWLNGPPLGIYAASKSAAWALTNGLRRELAAQHTQVFALHAGFIDTDLTKDLEVPKTAPEDIARTAIDAIESDTLEILADDFTRRAKEGLNAPTPIYL